MILTMVVRFGRRRRRRRKHARSLTLEHDSFAHWGSWSLTDRVAELKPKVRPPF